MTAPRPNRKLRDEVWSRDRGICQWSGRHLSDHEGDLQHRRAYGMGGTEVTWINDPSNLVLVSREAHMYIEGHPDEARGRGFRLDAGQHPECTPLIDYVGDVIHYGPGLALYKD